MRDRYTFPANDKGAQQRRDVADAFRKAGLEVLEFEETLSTPAGDVRLLKLAVGKRADEGKIAADMKRRKR